MYLNGWGVSLKWSYSINQYCINNPPRGQSHSQTALKNNREAQETIQKAYRHKACHFISDLRKECLVCLKPSFVRPFVFAEYRWHLSKWATSSLGYFLSCWMKRNLSHSNDHCKMFNGWHLSEETDCNYKCCQRKLRANTVLTWRMGEDQGKGEKKCHVHFRKRRKVSRMK